MSNRPNNVLQSTLLGNLNDKFVNIDNGMFTIHFFYDLTEPINVIVNYFPDFFSKILTLFENKLFSAYDRNKGKPY
jgi:hypothetical protein